MANNNIEKLSRDERANEHINCGTKKYIDNSLENRTTIEDFCCN